MFNVERKLTAGRSRGGETLFSVKPTSPFSTTCDEFRRIDGILSKPRRVVSLSLRISRLRKAIRPSQSIPIVDMESHGKDLCPKTWRGFEVADPSLSRWTGTTAFRRVEFDQRSSRATVFKNDILGMKWYRAGGDENGN